MTMEQRIQPNFELPPSLEMKVELHISCRKLKDLDVFSKSDPVCHFFLWNERTRSWTRFGHTEVVNNNLNPDFEKYFTISYSFEKQQRLRFVILDQDITDAEEIGFFETTLGNVMGSKNQTMTGQLRIARSNANRGQIIVRAEAVSESNHVIIYQITAHGLANKGGGCAGMCSEVRPVFYEIQREVGGVGSGHFVTSYSSPPAFGTQDPVWLPHKIRLSKFSNGDPNARVKIRLVSNRKEIGHIITTAGMLTQTRDY